MSEIFDQLLIRIIFTLYLCLGFFLFKYSHFLISAFHRKKLSKKINPNLNTTYSLDIFSRIMGLAIVFSPLEFNEYIGMSYSTTHFFIWSSIGILSYLGSLMVTNFVIFQKYQFVEEVEKKKNTAFGCISCANSISVAFMIRHILMSTHYSFFKFTLSWVIVTLLYCAVTRLFQLYSQNSFNTLMIQKNTGLALGYAGFLICHALIISSSLISEVTHDIPSELAFSLKILIGFTLVGLIKLILRNLVKTQVFDHPTQFMTNDYDKGIRDLVLFIFIGFLVSHLIHFFEYSFKFQIISLALIAFAFIYRLLHVFLYPSARSHFFSVPFNPINSLDLLHLFSRLIGIVLIFSNLYIVNDIQQFVIWAGVGFVLYLLSLVISENIIFYNFGYHDEIFKHKNYAYGLINFFNAICQGLIISEILVSSNDSIMSLVIFWLQSLVIYGLSTKVFKYIYHTSFDSLMIQKSLALGLTYSGFLVGNTLILIASISSDSYDIVGFVIQVFLKINLGMLIMPLFLNALPAVFKIQLLTDQQKDQIGWGISSFSLYVVAAILSSVIIGHIHFGTIYPFF